MITVDPFGIPMLRAHQKWAFLILSPSPGEVEVEQLTIAISWWQLAGIGGTLATAIAGGVFALMRWSIVRNIQALDARFDALEERMDKTDKRLDILYQRQESLVREATMKTDCAACRKDCQDRIAAGQRDMMIWMQRLEDKLERVIMMIANANNGLGGVKNGG